jgi:hypothetical protein
MARIALLGVFALGMSAMAQDGWKQDGYGRGKGDC